MHIECTTELAEDQRLLLLSTNPANMGYLTGYDGWSFYVHQLIALSRDAAQPLWIGRGMDANAAKVTTYLNHDNIFGYPDDYVQSRAKHPMSFVADLLASKGWDRGTIGVEMDSYYFTAACYQNLAHDLPNATLVDAGTLVNWMRVIKSANELEYVRQAARIIEKTMRTGVDMVKPGVRQCDAVAAIYASMVSGTPEFGGDHQTSQNHFVGSRLLIRQLGYFDACLLCQFL